MYNFVTLITFSMLRVYQSAVPVLCGCPFANDAGRVTCAGMCGTSTVSGSIDRLPHYSELELNSTTIPSSN